MYRAKETSDRYQSPALGYSHLQECHPWGYGGMTLSDFGRSVNPISTEKSRLSPPHYYWHRRIFRPSYGPDLVFGLVCGRLGRSRVHEFLVPARIHVQDLYKLTLVEIYE